MQIVFELTLILVSCGDRCKICEIHSLKLVYKFSTTEHKGMTWFLLGWWVMTALDKKQTNKKKRRLINVNSYQSVLKHLKYLFRFSLVDWWCVILLTFYFKLKMKI